VLAVAVVPAACNGDDDEEGTATTQPTTVGEATNPDDAGGERPPGPTPQDSATNPATDPEERDKLTGRVLEGYLRRASTRAGTTWRYSQILDVGVTGRRVEIETRFRPGRAAAAAAHGLCEAVREFFDDHSQYGPLQGVTVVGTPVRSLIRRC
jgi:hypothetical protein